MQSLSVTRLLILCLVVLAVPSVFAHEVTLSGTQTFASIDGSALDHDGAKNGVFTVDDGDLFITGQVTCLDSGAKNSNACSMAFVVSGRFEMSGTGALYAENRNDGGRGGAITLTIAGNVLLESGAIISSASVTPTGGNGGPIVITAGGLFLAYDDTTIDSGSMNAAARAITIAAGGVIAIDGDVLAGPTRTILASRLTGPILAAGTPKQSGGEIHLISDSYSDPAVFIGPNANIVSQGEGGAAGPVWLEGCGVLVHGLVAALTRRGDPAEVVIRSGTEIAVESDALGVQGIVDGTLHGRIRADAMSGSAAGNSILLFANGDISVSGPSVDSTYFALTALPGPKDSSVTGGKIRLMSLAGGIHASNNVASAGIANNANDGGSIKFESASSASLDTAVLRAVGAPSKKGGGGGGEIDIRSYAGDVLWTNGVGDVRPVGSASNLAPGDQGKIELTACGTIDTTGTLFPVNGVATSVFPELIYGLCSPVAPIPNPNWPPLRACNAPPVAPDVTAETLEDNYVTLTLTASDPQSDPLTFTIVTLPEHGIVGPITVVNDTTVTIDYIPELDFNGSDSFVYRADDGNGGTDDGTVNITVIAVNDPPSFTGGPNIQVAQNSGPYAYEQWATDISTGPANESGQTLTFQVSSSDPGYLLPAISPEGKLTFTAPTTTGTVDIVVTAIDDGGTDNGGSNESMPYTFTIEIFAVNAAPSFDPGPDVVVDEDSGAYSNPWATSISSGLGDPPQTLTFHLTNDNPALFAVQPAIDPSGVLSFATSADEFGVANLSVYLTDDGGTANGGVDTSPTYTFTITVNAVNDPPSFTSGGDVTVLEDSGAFSASWATAISSGPANESGQTLTFVVSNDNPSLFSVQPALSAEGVLTFTPAANAYDTANVSVSLADDGGGTDTYGPVAFAIFVTAVNDPPSFVGGGDITVNEDVSYSATWATSISPGPLEPSQSVTFVVITDNAALFSSAPAIGPDGTLTFAPQTNLWGTSNVTVVAIDNGGTANGGLDQSAPVTFMITIVAVNDPPVTTPETFSTYGNTSFVLDGAALATPHVLHLTGFGTGVLANDTDVEGDSLFISGIAGCSDITAPFVCTTPAGSILTVEANGQFRIDPAPGITSDSFQYAVTDVPTAPGAVAATTMATATINTSQMIWYVDGGAAAGGNGTSASPLNSLVSLNGAGGAGDTDLANAWIYVFSSTLSGEIELESGQHFIGGGVALNPNVALNGDPVTPLVPAGTKSVLASTTHPAVQITAALAAEVRGFALSGTNAVNINAIGAWSGATSCTIAENLIGATAAEAIKGSLGATGTRTFSIRNNSWDGVASHLGSGISLSRTVGDAVLDISYNTDILASGVGIAIAGGSVVNTTITGFEGNSVHQSTTGTAVSISAVTFDAVPGGSFNTVYGGSSDIGIPGNGVGGAGVILSGVAGDLAFTELDIFADGGTAFLASGLAPYTGSAGFRIIVDPLASSFEAIGGPAVDIATASLTLPLLSMSSTNSPTTGVALNSVAGSFSTGATSSISNITSGAGAAFQVANSNVSVDYPGTINITQGKGVYLTTNSGSTFAFSGLLTLTSGGNNAFTATGGGTVTATNTANTLTTTTGIALDVENTTIGSGGLTFKSISAGTAAAGPVNGIILTNTGSSGILVVTGTGSAGSGGTIQRTTSDGILLTATRGPSFTSMALANNGANGIRGTQVENFSFTNGSIASSTLSNIAFDTSGAGTETNLSGAVTITGNSLTTAGTHGVNILNFNGTITSLNISSNTITSSTSAASSLGSAIRIQILGSLTTVANLNTATINNNTITNFPSGAGIQVQGGNANLTGSPATVGTPGGAEITITGNFIRGDSAANPMGTSAILATISGKGQANFNVSNNGSVASPLTNVAGIAIGIGANGNTTATATTSNNVIVANNMFASGGISGGAGITFGATDTPLLTWTISGNTISATDGNGILAVARSTNGTLNATITNNSVAAPLTGVRPGIRVDSGTATGDTNVCLTISGNTSAGSGGSQGIGLRKQGTDPTINSFGIVGMAATSTPGVEAYVDSLNPAGGGTLLISATSGFSGCS